MFVYVSICPTLLKDVHVLCLRRPKEGVGRGVTGSCKPTGHGYWEPNLGLLSYLSILRSRIVTRWIHKYSVPQ